VPKNEAAWISPFQAPLTVMLQNPKVQGLALSSLPRAADETSEVGSYRVMSDVASGPPSGISS